MFYYNRILDDSLKEYLEMVGAVLVVGPKWCGKTTTAKRHAKSVIEFQNPDKRDSYLELANFKPSLLLEGEKPRLIDEWQIAPVVWDAVRTSVDKSEDDGLYILTGSTSVDESQIMHSGTGRISRLMMRPMSLFESKESNGKISLKDLFENPDLDIDGIQSDLSIEDLVFAACRGGWPDSLNKRTDHAKLFVAYNYVDSICESDVSSVDGVKRNPEIVRAILRTYARNISTLTTNKTLISDIRSNFTEMSDATFYSYVNALERLFVISNVDSWRPNVRSKSSIRASSKKEFIDPSIAVAALNLSPRDLLFDLETFGFIFENLCIRDLAVYSSLKRGHISYYRDRGGLEADCVIRLRDGRYGLIEFKLGSRELDKGAKNLLKLNDLIKEKGFMEPSFLAILTGTEIAYTRPDGVKVIPIGTLRD
ncbi:MAG: DUF4143 domain-containing protein [Methanobrevibacter sp.]|uniref:ATP-binding protein n=1 Tax=Methanobrevibacter sp. TaxID=66852 RepID=UPI0026DEF21F|nr:DUF4143 domain-containing protein [Methanobrevibacter sp.]MDO5849206.1 DUF4143 domain-containing protein [Methanobrevibacter sp.]